MKRMLRSVTKKNQKKKQISRILNTNLSSRNNVQSPPHQKKKKTTKNTDPHQSLLKKQSVKNAKCKSAMNTIR